MAELAGELLDDDCGGVACGSRRLDVDVEPVYLTESCVQREFGSGTRSSTCPRNSMYHVGSAGGDDDREARIAAGVAGFCRPSTRLSGGRRPPRGTTAGGLRGSLGPIVEMKAIVGRLEHGDQCGAGMLGRARDGRLSTEPSRARRPEVWSWHHVRRCRPRLRTRTSTPPRSSRDATPHGAPASGRSTRRVCWVCCPRPSIRSLGSSCSTTGVRPAQRTAAGRPDRHDHRPRRRPGVRRAPPRAPGWRPETTTALVHRDLQAVPVIRCPAT